MPYQDFPPSLLTLSPRLTRTGDPSSSVQGINTTTLGDGALVYCEEGTSTFRLDKADDTTPPDGTTVIQPAAGPGRWKVFGGSVRGVIVKRNVQIQIPVIGAPGANLLTVNIPGAVPGMAVIVQGDTLNILFLTWILPVGVTVVNFVDLMAYSIGGSDGSQVATVDIFLFDVG